MTEKKRRKTPREYMIMAIEVMKKSIQEKRKDKSVPYVGAVLVMSDGTEDTAYRGELRDGDHAEYTLLDKKNRNKDLTGSWLFVTLEPCAPGARNAPKISCAERIVNARISDVWFGIEDPDPKVDHSGINFLLENSIKVHQFDTDLHKRIKKINKEFLKGAYIRKEKAKKEKSIPKDELNKKAEHTDIESLSKEALQLYIDKTGGKLKFNSSKFLQELKQLELLDTDNNNYIPTGNAILLFGKNPRLKFQQASVKAKVNYGNGEIDVQSFDDALVFIPDKVESWIKKVIPESFERSKFKREKIPFFPTEVIREAIINAIVHRDYSIDGAKVQLEITPDKIIVKSPGKPIPPVTIVKLQNFTATSFSRNKKLTFIFNKMDLMEETSVGMDTYRSLRDKYKLPIISFEEPNLIVAFPRIPDAVRDISSNKAIEKLNDEELAGYDFVKTRGEVSRKEYAEYFAISDKTALRHLTKMRFLDLIGDNGEKINSPKYRYAYNG